jgi:uncharacterized glyoxalase superfamily protein PhnB
VIFYHYDVDALHARVVAAGYRPDTAPGDAKWGERFFHLTDPDGHELSFAQNDHTVAVCTEDIAWMHSMIGSAPNQQ